MAILKPEIIYEDSDILVVHKPAGLATQTKKVGEKDLVSELKKYLKGGYVGVVHRLDQPVEGLLVFGKNQKATAKLSSFEGFNKEYRATVLGVPSKEKATLTDYMIKTKDNVAKIVPESEAFKNKDAKRAELIYEVTERFDECATLKVTLLTGRFHQIRCQLANIGHPILGDRKYGNELSNELANRLGIKYTALCAVYLVINHPTTGKTMEFSLE